MKTFVEVTVRDENGFVLKVIRIKTNSPIPAAVSVAAALREHFPPSEIEFVS